MYKVYILWLQVKVQSTTTSTWLQSQSTLDYIFIFFSNISSLTNTFNILRWQK